MRLAVLALVLCMPAAMAQAKKPEKKKFEVSETEQAVIDATNAERKAKKLTAYKMNEQLMEVARGHAANMAKQERYVHELDDKTVGDRATAAKYKWARIGENVSWNQKDAESAVAAWMESEGHKANILSEQFTEIGVAMSKSEKGETYWCQVFAKPRK